MFGDVSHVGNQVQYRTLKLPVPRCGKCKSAHKVRGVMKWLFTALGGLIGLGGCESGAFLITVPLGAGVGYGIGWILGRLFTIGFKPESFGNQFPMVKKGELEGWAVGEKPHGVQ